jgi:hypothetical protein
MWDIKALLCGVSIPVGIPEESIAEICQPGPNVKQAAYRYSP